MGTITLAQAQAKLDKWLAADDAVATGQSYMIDGIAFTRANAKMIRDNIDYWNNKVAELDAGGGRTVKGVLPID